MKFCPVDDCGVVADCRPLKEMTLFPLKPLLSAVIDGVHEENDLRCISIKSRYEI